MARGGAHPRGAVGEALRPSPRACAGGCSALARQRRPARSRRVFARRQVRASRVARPSGRAWRTSPVATTGTRRRRGERRRRGGRRARCSRLARAATRPPTGDPPNTPRARSSRAGESAASPRTQAVTSRRRAPRPRSQLTRASSLPAARVSASGEQAAQVAIAARRLDQQLERRGRRLRVRRRSARPRLRTAFGRMHRTSAPTIARRPARAPPGGSAGSRRARRGRRGPGRRGRAPPRARPGPPGSRRPRGRRRRCGSAARRSRPPTGEREGTRPEFRFLFAIGSSRIGHAPVGGRVRGRTIRRGDAIGHGRRGGSGAGRAGLWLAAGPAGTRRARAGARRRGRAGRGRSLRHGPYRLDRAAPSWSRPSGASWRWPREAGLLASLRPLLFGRDMRWSDAGRSRRCRVATGSTGAGSRRRGARPCAPRSISSARPGVRPGGRRSDLGAPASDTAAEETNAQWWPRAPHAWEEPRREPRASSGWPRPTPSRASPAAWVRSARRWRDRWTW